MSDSFIREIEEDLRRDRLKAVWERYGTALIGMVAAVIIGTGGYVYWDNLQAQRAADAGDRFLDAVAAVNDGNNEEAELLLEGLVEGGSGYALMAELRQASLLAERGDDLAAADAFDAIAANTSDPIISSLATVRGAMLRVDTESYEAMTSRIGSLTDDDEVWRHSAREILGLSAYRHQNYPEARQWFGRLLGDPEVPANMRQRADVILSIIDGLAPAEAPEASDTEAAGEENSNGGS